MEIKTTPAMQPSLAQTVLKDLSLKSIPESSTITTLPQIQAKRLVETNSQFYNNISRVEIELTKIVFIILALCLLALALVLGVGIILFRIQSTATKVIANALAIANYKNYLEMKKYPERVVPITSSLDVAKLLPQGLPEGYQIIKTPVPRGLNVACVLIGPLRSKALFTVTGVSPYYSTKSTSSVEESV